MADGFNAKDASGATVAVDTDQVTDTDTGVTGQVQYVKIMDGTVNGITKAAVGTAGLKVDGSGATQPVSAASLPLPTGASTAAKQPALGTAGAASADVITVQGIASMTAVKVDGSAVTQPVSGTVTVQQSTAANLKVDLSGTAANATAIKVDNSAVTQPVSGTISVSSGPAAARTTDSISAALATDAIMNGTTVLTPSFAAVTASASGATTIVSAVASKKIRVLGIFLVCTSAVSVNLQSHTTTATKTGTMPFAANGGISVSFSPVGWFETVAGEALDINLGGAVAVGGQVVYTTL